jgi:ABC-type transport system substrate-binding protein
MTREARERDTRIAMRLAMALIALIACGPTPPATLVSPSPSPSAARTESPPIAAARVEGTWDVTLRLSASLNTVDPLTPVLRRTYTFAPNCASGACSLRMVREAGGACPKAPCANTVTVASDAAYDGRAYSGGDTRLIPCFSKSDDTLVLADGIRSVSTYRFTVDAAATIGGVFRATEISGTLATVGTPREDQSSCNVSGSDSYTHIGKLRTGTP